PGNGQVLKIWQRNTCHRQGIPSLFACCHPPQKFTKYHNVSGVFTLLVSVSRIPTSEITAESLVVNGVSVSQTDHEGIHSSQRRSCISTGMFLEKTDGSGNTIMEETDVAGRPG
ncbi:hypothetical protein, partial [Akkermansia sp.]|uniref:hypothetical protein n=1 Tax=Akkermansia sp. TaxID=1872421 RepID=UPI00266C5735